MSLSLSSNVLVNNIETQKKYLLRKYEESFDTGVVKKLIKFQYWTKKTCLWEKKRVF